MSTFHHARLCAVLLASTSLTTMVAIADEAPATTGVEKITITGKKIAKSATKTDTPIRQVPQSIQVIPGSVIKDQGNVTVAEATRNVAGVQATNPVQTPAYESTIIRGFAGEQWLDGLTSFYNAGNRDSLVNVERIEILKGPNAILYGGGTGAPLGGVINVVSKMPEKKAFAQIGTTFGSHQFKQPTIDVNMPIAADGTVLFRITADYTSADSYIDVIETNKYSVNPTLLLTDNDGTTLTIQGRISDWRAQEYQGLPATGTITGGFSLDRHLFVGPSDIPKSYSRVESVTAKLEHAFDETWTANLQTRLGHTDFRENAQSFAAGFDFAGNAPLFGTSWNVLNIDLFQQQDEFSVNGTVTGKFEGDGFKGTILVGADYSEVSDEGAMLGDVNDIFLLPPVDLTAPVFASYVYPANTALNTFVDGVNTYTTKGIYAQVQSTLWENVHVLGGVRLANLQIDNVSPAFGLSQTSDTTRALPRIGAVVDVSPEFSFFANYSESMKGNAFSFFLGEPVPEESDQIEAGVKFEFANGISGTAALFELNRTGVPVGFPAIANGEQRSRGFDIDMTWQADDNWFVLANYAHIEAELTRNAGGGVVGNQLNTVTPDSGRLWVGYRFTQPGYRGLSAGAGIYVASGAYVDLANVYETDGYHTVDAKIGYEDEVIAASLAVKNLTNEKYFVPYTYLGGRVAPGEELTVYGSLAVKFR
jgi:iron complex outermembrane receptor protein